jgi:excisionase family DNA binding protein
MKLGTLTRCRHRVILTYSFTADKYYLNMIEFPQSPTQRRGRRRKDPLTMPGATTGEAPLLTVKDLCQRWLVSERFIYRRTEAGSPDPLPFIKLGGTLRFRPEAVDRWLAERESA